MESSAYSGAEARMVTGCEVCDHKEIVARGYHSNKRLFFEETTGSGRIDGRPNYAIWPVCRGAIGSGVDCETRIWHVDVEPKHATVSWSGTFDKHVLFDANSSTGTFLVLSSTRSCRDKVEIFAGDVILLSKKAKARGSAASSAGMSGSGKEKSALNLADYVQLRVNDVVPAAAEQDFKFVDHIKSKRESRRESREFTFRRDSSTTARSTLLQQKAMDSDFENIKQAFLANSEKYEPYFNDAMCSGLVSRAADVEEAKDEAKLKVRIVDVVVAPGVTEEGRRLKRSKAELRRNTLGGSSLFEEEEELESVVCDDNVSQEQLQELEEEASSFGVASDIPNDGAHRAKQIAHPADVRQIKSKADGFEVNKLLLEQNCKIELEVVSGCPSLKGKVFSFGLNDLSIGSHMTSSIQIPELSSFHVSIQRDEFNSFWLKDLSVGHVAGTMLQLTEKRGVAVMRNDVFRLGPSLEVVAREPMDAPAKVLEVWDGLALKVIRARHSYRYRQITSEAGFLFDEKYFVMSSDEEMTIGRRVQECDLAVQDYEMPAFAAVINRFDNRFFISALQESRKKGVYLELSNRYDEMKADQSQFERRRIHKIGRIHKLEKGDTFRVGRSQLVVAHISTEGDKVIASRHDELVHMLSEVDMLTGLEAEDLSNLASAACHMRFNEDEVLLKQGSDVTGLFIIERGTVDIYHESHPEKVLKVLGPYSCMGEMSLFTGFGASASVRAREEVRCLYIDLFMVQEVINPASFEIMKALNGLRVMENHVHDLKMVPQLENCKKRILLILASRMFRMVLPHDAVMFQPGDKHDCMYVVGSGKVVLSSPSTAEEAASRKKISTNTVKKVHGGGFFFHEALDGDANEAFTIPCKVTSSGISVLFGLRRADFDEVMAMSEVDLNDEVAKVNSKFDELRAVRNRGLGPSVQQAAHSGTNAMTGSVFEVESRVGAEKVSNSSTSVSQRHLTLGGHRIAPFSSRGASHGDPQFSGSTSLGEGEEGESLQLLNRIMDEKARRLGTQESSDDNSSVGSKKRGSVADIADDEITEASFGTEFSELDDFDEPIGEDEAIEHTLFCPKTELEKECQAVPLAELERCLQDHPFYIVLKCVSGPQKRQVFIINDSVTLIGRWIKPKADAGQQGSYPGRRFISLNDRTVSKVNSIIQYRGGAFFLNDAESKYGTHLKLKINNDYKLEVGDVITCSQHEFHVRGRCELAAKPVPSSCCIIL